MYEAVSRIHRPDRVGWGNCESIHNGFCKENKCSMYESYNFLYKLNKLHSFT